MPVALTIAGSDSGGGAGIQADLKTFAAHGVYGTSVVTAVTAQNTVAVTGVEEMPLGLIRSQMDALAADIPIDALKTGMLSSSKIIATITGRLRSLDQFSQVPLVVDPVMVSKGGHRLLKPGAVKALVGRLIPMAHVVTPNLPEAEVLVGFELNGLQDWKRAAKRIVEMGAHSVVIKGGHSSGEEVVDLLFTGKRFRSFSAPRIDSTSTHGTGCTFSAAICALLARGEGLEKAVEHAKSYLHEAIRAAPGLGEGHGPVHHFVRHRAWRRG